MRSPRSTPNAAANLLVSRFYQTAIARQSRSREDRRPYFLLMDEAGDLLTSTVSEILKGTRKYGLSLTLAHQSLARLRRDDEVYGAVTGSCGTKVCFQVGGDDARKMAEEVGGFTAPDPMNQPSRFALARVGPRDQSFNLEVSFVPKPVRPFEETYAEVLAATRERYCTPRATIREELAALRGMIPPEKGADPFARLKARQNKERKEQGANPPPPATSGPAPKAAPKEEVDSEPEAPSSASPAALASADADVDEPEPDEVRADPNAESIKTEIIQASGGCGYSNYTEKDVNQKTGRVDVVLTLGSVVVACEISATTSAKHEVGNLLKCLRAGFERIVYVCDVTHRRRRTEEQLRKCGVPFDLRRFEFLTKRQFIVRLGEIAEHVKVTENPQASGVGKTVLNAPNAPNELSTEERNEVSQDAWAEIQRNKKRDRKKRTEGK